MENKDTKEENLKPNNKVAAIRTLKDDIAKATEARKTGEATPEPFPILPPIPPKKEEEEKKVEKEVEIPKINPFIRSDILQFKDGELPENPKKTQFEVSPIRTYTGDVAQAVKTGNTSVIQIAVAEQKEKEKEREIEDTGRSQFKKNILMIVGSVILVALGAGIFYYIISTRNPEKIVETPKNNELIVAESEKEIVLTEDKKKFLEELGEAVRTTPPASSIQNIKVVKENPDKTTKAITSLEFLPLIAGNIPQSLVRSFNPEFIFGVYGGEQPTPYIILKIDSFENAFAGMLKWEENMRSDIGELFFDKTDQETTLSLGSSTPFFDKGFKDSIIKNQDTRVTMNSGGKIILLYSFINKDILIITRNPATFNELIQRLRRVQILR